MREGSGTRVQKVQVALACSGCSARNYKTKKVRRDGAPPLQLRKFCKICNKHTVHEETR